jgi:sec-independent protein translocase protein TatA
MFGSVGSEELILIFIVALLVFGPKKLPEIGRSVGKAIREFKKTSEEIRGRIEEEIQASEIKDVHKDIKSGWDSLQSGVRGFQDRIKQTMGLDDPAKSPTAAETTSASVTSCELAPESHLGVEDPAPVPESASIGPGHDPYATPEGKDVRHGISPEAGSLPEDIDKDLTAHETEEGRSKRS